MNFNETIKTQAGGHTVIEKSRSYKHAQSETIKAQIAEFEARGGKAYIAPKNEKAAIVSKIRVTEH